MEDILKECNYGRTIGIVVRESDLEAEDGIGIWAWQVQRRSAKRVAGMRHTADNGDTFAHEQHSCP
jgi:hypothetical protein